MKAIVLICSLAALGAVDAEVYSYERNVNMIDDGFNRITNYESKVYDSASMPKPHVEGKTIVLPSKYKSNNGFNNLMLRKQRNTNRVGIGFELKMPKSVFDKRLEQDRSKFKVKGRSVESPAYSVDSGGQASSSIAGEIAKILNVKQGHYADVYNRLDRPAGWTTKKPLDVIENTMRVAVQQAWANKRNN